MGTKKDKHTSLVVGLIMVGIATLLLLITLGVFNPAGKYIKDFLLGTFGLSFYGITVACLIIGVLKIFNFRLNASLVRILEVVGIYSLFILAFHATSYDYLAMSSNYGEYIAKCYYGANTAGGALGAIVMYPLMMVNNVFAIVVVALLLFALIAVTMFAGKFGVRSTRTHAVKYSGKRKKEEEVPTHVEVDSSLLNEDVAGNPLGDFKKRSRFSKAPIEYVPLESEEELSDEDVVVEYKDQFACSSDTEDASTITDEDRKRASESLYGGMDESDRRARHEDSMTDHEMFLAAVNRIRNNEDSSYIDHLTMDDDDYVEYSDETREEIITEDSTICPRDDASDNINIDDFDVNESDTYDSSHLDAILGEESNDTEIVSANIMDTGDDGTIDDDTIDEEMVSDESISYDIDDFGASLDKTFTIGGIDDDSEYNMPFYSRDEQYKTPSEDIDDSNDAIEDSGCAVSTADESIDNIVDDNIDDEPSDNNIDDIDNDKGNTAVDVEEVESRESSTPTNNDRVSNIEDELLAGSDSKRRRRSDYGGTHRSQYADNTSHQSEDVASSSEDDESDVDVSSFINPFKNTTKAVEEDTPKAEQEEAVIEPYVTTLGYKYKVPPLSLLNDYVSNVDEENASALDEQCHLIEENLKTFGIYATIKGVVKGPTFSRIELAMDKGTGKSVKAILNLAQDIEMWLGCNGHVNILAPIPGKTTIGIEVPNTKKRTVGLKEVFNSRLFNEKKWRIPFALGVDIDNESHVADIVKMPHLLIAGSTGSGKSVGISALLTSILYSCSPDEVKLILIDPKKVELSDYEGLPHMLIKKPIFESRQVINVLDWLIAEMERRYTALASVHASKIEEYNEMLESKGSARMPYILIVIDEVADLMTDLKKDLEDRINKLAAKSRAAGIHLVLATQRPSVDIITGKIKANLPSRIAFATVQPEDSRTILGSIGAEKLLRDGDMLFMNSTSPLPERIQGAFISKKEVVAITDYVRENNPADFDDGIQEFIEHDEKEAEEESISSTSRSNGNDGVAIDDRFVEALEALIKEGKASITLLQRKLGLGWARAGKIYDQLVECGYVKDKEVLISHMQFMKLFGEDSTENQE